jgi:glycosyltransferase involved in cell wall biosynthesis
MRVLIGVHHFPPSGTAGAEWQAFRTAHALQQRGHDIRVVTIERVDQGPPGGVAFADDDFRGIPVRRLSFDRGLAPDEKLWEYRNPWVGDHVHDLLAAYRPDVFHVCSGYLLSGTVFEAAERLGIPTTLALMDFWWLCPRVTLLRTDGTLSGVPVEPWRCARCIGEERRAFRLLGQCTPAVADRFWQAQRGAIRKIEERQRYLGERLTRVQRIISPSRFLNDQYLIGGAPRDRMAVARQGIELVDLGLSAPKTPSAEVRIAYLGQIAELKGVHLLLEAARQILDPRLRVRIYGDLTRFPEYVSRLKQLASGDDRITFAGPYAGSSDLPRVLAEVDAVVVPSIWYENSPNVILEAFALNTPCVVSDFGGMAELVAPEVNGLRFQLGEAADLAHQLRRLLTEPDLLPRLAAGIPAVKSIRQEMDELEHIFEEVRAQTVA